MTLIPIAFGGDDQERRGVSMLAKAGKSGKDNLRVSRGKRQADELQILTGDWAMLSSFSMECPYPDGGAAEHHRVGRIPRAYASDAPDDRQHPRSLQRLRSPCLVRLRPTLRHSPR